ncbi:sensor histidine kinase [Actinacidiphila rubida]|uniref:histidine kinase n=1 Tax=Actinacidiphila rubida TaxID=310780 RepID=A0A1H8T6Q0_9ACTN|nr:histidine kinase [Actinacidiphila rubida]SEO86168.1 Signal transduction histidine kinase [Actinacidiphila rubida]
MAMTRPWTARVSAVPVVACVWALSTLYMVLAASKRLRGPWGAAAPRYPFLSDPRERAALALAAVLVGVACGLLTRRPPWSVAALVLSALVLNLDIHSSDITPDQYLPVCAALYFVAAAGSRRTAAAGAVPALAGLFGYVAVRQAKGLDVDTTVEAVVLLITVLAWALGDAQRRERRHAEELRTQVAEQAVTAERLRIARELHDMVAHSIGVVALQAGAAKLVLRTQPEGAGRALGIIEDTSRETLAGLRRMVGALHDADDGTEARTGTGTRTPPAGLDDMDRLVANARDAGVRVDVEWRGERRPLPPDIDLSVFRIIQESVTNVMKHSGSRQCRVSVAFREDDVSLVVVDSGTGRSGSGTGGGGRGSGTGYGLIGMSDRVALLHGDFSAGPRPEGGFRVAARVPVPAEV